MQTTNVNNKKIPATTSSARIPKAQTPKAAAVVSSSKLEASGDVAPSEVETKTAKKASPPAAAPVGLALEGWGLANYDSSDEEQQGAGGPVAVRAKSSSSAAAAKKGGSGTSKSVAGNGKGKARAPSKEKYLRPAQPTTALRQEDDDKLMPGSATSGIIGGGGLLLSPFDPFADAAGDAGAGKATKDDVVHLRVQQRNGKKTLTTVQGLSDAYNYAKILRDLKRDLCCSGVVIEDEELGSVIQLQGDHRKTVAAFLVKAGMATKANVKVHGF